jgi:sulfur carrier protein
MIRVNDKFDVEWEEGMTVRDVLRELKFSFPLLVVSVDGELVPRDAYSTHEIPEGAEIKVLHMTAGG